MRTQPLNTSLLIFFCIIIIVMRASSLLRTVAHHIFLFNTHICVCNAQLFIYNFTS